MATAEQLRERFREIAMENSSLVSNIAKVKYVDEERFTCVLVDEDGQEIINVRLKPVLTANLSFLQIPKIGSYVLAVRIEDDDDWMVIASDEVEKFLWKTSTSNVEISDKICLSANGVNLLSLMERLFTVLERGYTTNNGPTIKLIMHPEFNNIKKDFKQLLK